MSEEKNMDTTSVEQVDVNLDEIFSGAPGADSITLPEETESKPNIFSRDGNVDLTFLDEKIEEVTETVEEKVESTDAEVKTEAKEEVKKEVKKPEVTPTEVDDILNEGLELAEDEEEKSTVKGRKRIEGMTDVFKKMIEDDQIVPFVDDKDLDEYSAKDWK